jgi:hypothetical protein
MKYSNNTAWRRTALLAGALAVALGAAMLATSGSAQQPAGRTIILLPNFKKGSIHQVLVPPKHAGPLGGRSFVGDETIQIVPLNDAAGRRVGTWYAELTFVTPSKHGVASVFEHSVYVLTGGSIIADSLNGPGKLPPPAVTGGSGAYAGAAGSVDESFGPKTQEIAIQLLP